MDSISSPPEKDLLMITQDGCSIESYVEEFLQLAQQGDWNDDSLKIVFWSGLSNHLFLQAPPAATPGSLAQYIDHVLILAGSSFTVEEVPASQPLPTARPVPPPAAKSVYPRARKWASNSADLRAKVLDPSLTSVRSALKSTPCLPSQRPPAAKSVSPASAAKSVPVPPPAAMMGPPPATKMVPPAAMMVPPPATMIESPRVCAARAPPSDRAARAPPSDRASRAPPSDRASWAPPSARSSRAPSSVRLSRAPTRFLPEEEGPQIYQRNFLGAIYPWSW